MARRGELARRLVRRLRRELHGLRRPRATLLKWLRVEPAGAGPAVAAVALGRPRLGLHGQPADRVVLGTGLRLGDHVDVHLGPAGRVEIGDDVWLGAHVQIAADALVRIGTGSRIADYCVLADTWTYGRPATVPAPDPAPVVLGEGVRLGVRTVVGPGVEVAAGTAVPTGSLLHLDAKATR